MVRGKKQYICQRSTGCKQQPVNKIKTHIITKNTHTRKVATFCSYKLSPNICVSTIISVVVRTHTLLQHHQRCAAASAPAAQPGRHFTLFDDRFDPDHHPHLPMWSPLLCTQWDPRAARGGTSSSGPRPRANLSAAEASRRSKATKPHTHKTLARFCLLLVLLSYRNSVTLSVTAAAVRRRFVGLTLQSGDGGVNSSVNLGVSRLSHMGNVAITSHGGTKICNNIVMSWVIMHNGPKL